MTSSRHVINFPELSLCVPMCSCRVLRGVKPDGAPADGDDELHPRLPHPPLGGHAHALLEASLPYGCPGDSPYPRWMEVSLTLSALKRMMDAKNDVQVDSGVAKLAAGEGSHQGGFGPIGTCRPMQQSGPPGSSYFPFLCLKQSAERCGLLTLFIVLCLIIFCRRMRLRGSLRKRNRLIQTIQSPKPLSSKCSKRKIFASTPFSALSSGELSL